MLSSAPTQEYRTYAALSTTLLLVGILPLVFSEKIKYRMFLGGIAFLLMIMGACWAHKTVKKYFAIPDSKEIRYIIHSIRAAQLNGQADFSGVVLVMIRHSVGPGQRNEIGQLNTTHGPNIRPIVMTALNELGIKKKVRVFFCSLDTLNSSWGEYGMIFTKDGLGLPLTRVTPQKNTIIVDMDKINECC